MTSIVNGTKEGLDQERMNTPLRKQWRYGAGSEGSGNWL